MAEAPHHILLLPGPLEPRSTTSHTLYLARRLRDLGHDARVLTPGGPLEPEFTRAGIPFLAEPRLAMPLLASSAVVRALRAFERDRFVPALLHAQNPEVDRVAAHAARRGIPVFLSIHTALRRRQRVHLPVPLLKGVVAGSQEIREVLVNHRRVPRDLIRIITTGVDAQSFRPDGHIRPRRRFFVPVVGMVGRLESHKGAHIFIQAAKIVADQGHDVHFVLSGDGPENENLRERVQALGLEGRFTFAPESRDYRSLLGALDILVRPATREGLGMSLLEAMACGKPVVATGVGSTYGIVRDGETGYIVPRGDTAKLAIAVTKLVTQPAKALEMGRRARKLVEESYDITEKAKETVAFYRERLAAD